LNQNHKENTTTTINQIESPFQFTTQENNPLTSNITFESYNPKPAKEQELDFFEHYELNPIIKQEALINLEKQIQINESKKEIIFPELQNTIMDYRIESNFENKTKENHTSKISNYIKPVKEVSINNFNIERNNLSKYIQILNPEFSTPYSPEKETSIQERTKESINSLTNNTITRNTIIKSTQSSFNEYFDL
jgi:hypothetical protein